MGIFNIKPKQRKSPFSGSSAILAEEGFSERYEEKLRSEVTEDLKPSEKAAGYNYLINALIIEGKLSEGYEVFADMEKEGLLSKLDKYLLPNLLHNVIFSLFARDRFKDAEELYKKYNSDVLKEHTDTMRRTLAIHEFINERYENAVTILAKLMDSPCGFIDFCLVKTVLRLDMYDRADEISVNFDAYKGKYELEKAVSKMRKRIFDGLSPKKKVNAVKRRKK